VHARSRKDVDVVKALRAQDAAYVLWGDDTVGLARSRPVRVNGVTVGVAGPVPLPDLPAAHRQATTAFETAWALGLEGVADLPSLGLKAAVQASPEVGVELRRRYLAPLTASGTLGEELLATARAFLECGSRRDLAATRLHVHQNTVGYRLNRVCELTGVDLSDLTTLAELHWLFTDVDLRG
jgi:DNA-binding PucR family transcriptional regulator